MSDNPLYVFFHLPKCAGSTMRTFIEENLPTHESLPLYSTDGKPLLRNEMFSRIESLSMAQRQRVKLVYGHEVHYGAHEPFNRPARYFTFVRHPVDRAYSFYNYHMTLAIKSGALRREEVPIFSDWLSNSPWMTNEMLGCFFDYGYHPRTTEVTDKVLGSVLEKFDFIGLTERNDQDTLFALRHFKIRRHFDSVNLSEQFADKTNAAFATAIRAISGDDLRLFDLAVARNALDRAQPDYMTEVKRMRRMKERWEAVHRIVRSVRTVLCR